MALTEVLKVIAEDRASGTIKRIENATVRMGLIGESSAAKFSRKLENLFGDVIVGGAKSAVFALAALATATAGLGVKALQSRLEFDKLREAAGGGTSAFLGAFRDLEGSFDNLQKSIANFLIDGLKLPTLMQNVATGIDKITKAIDDGKLDRFLKGLAKLGENRMARALLLQSGPAGAVVGGALGMIGIGSQVGGAAGAAAGGPVMRIAPIGIKLMDPKERERLAQERQRAEQARLDQELEDRQAAEDAANAASQAEFNRMIREREKAREQADRDYQVFLNDRQFREEAEARANEEKLAREAAANDLEEQIQREQAIRQEQLTGKIYGTVDAISSGINAAAQFWQVMNDGASTSGQKIGAVLSLIGSLVGSFVSIFAPGVGSAAGGLLGSIGGVFSMFSNGGVVHHAAGGMVVPGVGAGDRVPAMLEPGETVVPKRGSHPDFIQEVAAAAGGGGVHLTINQGYLVPPTQTETKRMMTKAVIPAISDLAQNNRARLRDPRVRSSDRGRRS